MEYPKTNLVKLLQFLQQHKRAEYLRYLLSSNADAINVQQWLKEHAREGLASNSGFFGIEDWEVEIYFLSAIFSNYSPLTEFEKTPSEDRKNHLNKIIKTCEELADLLEDESNPNYPSVLELFDPEKAADIVRCLPKAMAEKLLRDTGYPANDLDCYELDDKNSVPIKKQFSPGKDHPGKKLISYMGTGNGHQQLPPILRRLAQHAEHNKHPVLRNTRPNSEESNIKTFSRELEHHFNVFFGTSSGTVILSCALLMFPKFKDSINIKKIKRWLR